LYKIKYFKDVKRKILLFSLKNIFKTDIKRGIYFKEIIISSILSFVKNRII